MTLVFLLLLAGLPDTAKWLPGPVNGLRVGSVLVYGDPTGQAPPAKHVLLTHSRRDVTWAAEGPVKAGAEAIAPEADRDLFQNPQAFWAGFEKGRFHDYAQNSTRVPAALLRVSRWVKDGERMMLDGTPVRVLATPGYAPNSVTYLIETGGRRIACTGDLIYGDGQLLDVYSLQDAIPETKTRGYHGYAARAGALIQSLRRVLAEKPDVLVPSRGPVIEQPEAAIQKLIGRMERLLESHFKTDALRWYWGYESLRQRSQAAGLTNGVKEVMPMGEEAALPDWVLPIENSRLLVSRSGGAFLLDNGSTRVEPELARLKAEGRFRQLEGIWVTHYHDDHTDYVDRLSKATDAPVYFSDAVADILERPGSYRMPASTSNPIRGQRSLADGHRWRWREFDLQSFRFPGQTLYHGALRVSAEGGESLLFVGDSFTAAGMDDYCLQNRNLVGRGQGYEYCLDLIEKLGGRDWLINQHCKPMFRFTKEQIALMRAELRKREAVLAELTPLPGPNFAVDESWARVYPYASEVAKGGSQTLELRIVNHAATVQTFRANWGLPPALTMVDAGEPVTLKPGQEGKIVAKIKADSPGLHVPVVDVSWGEWQLPRWTEAMVRVP